MRTKYLRTYKRTFIFILLLCYLIFLTLAPSAQATTLQYGSSGTAVTELQNKLISLGYLEPGNNTGYFGTLTKNAVRAFQKAKGIVSTGNESTTGYGMVGPKTKTKLENLYKTTKTSSIISTDYAKNIGNKDNLQSLIDELNLLIKKKQQSNTSSIAKQKNSATEVSASTKKTQESVSSVTTQKKESENSSVTTEKTCTVGNKSIAHGEKITMYEKQTVEINESCDMFSAEQICDNGSLKSSKEGDYDHLSCKVDSEVTLLRNPGPKYNAGLTLANTPKNSNGYVAWASSLDEAHLVGNPVKSCPEGYTYDSDKITASKDGSCASFYVDTKVGWKSGELNKLPGWSIWNLSGGGGKSLERTYLNNAYGTANPCELREIGLVYNHWPGDPGNTHFRPNNDGSYTKLGQFDKVFASFKAKSGTNDSSPTCASVPSQRIQIDFRIGFIKPNTETIFQTNLVGIVLSGMDGIDIYGKPHDSEIHYQGEIDYSNTSVKIVLLHGERIGVPRLNTAYQTYKIDFKTLVEKYAKPPAGYTLDDAVFTGLDIYTSTQGGNQSFTLKDVDLVGTFLDQFKNMSQMCFY